MQQYWHFFSKLNYLCAQPPLLLTSNDQIYALPSHALLFRAAEAFTAPMFFCDSRLNESEDDIPEDAKLDYLSITDIGKDRSRPHLTVRIAPSLATHSTLGCNADRSVSGRTHSC